MLTSGCLSFNCLAAQVSNGASSSKRQGSGASKPGNAAQAAAAAQVKKEKKSPQPRLSQPVAAVVRLP
jgi:hypothetical protein